MASLVVVNAPSMFVYVQIEGLSPDGVRAEIDRQGVEILGDGEVDQGSISSSVDAFVAQAPSDRLLVVVGDGGQGSWLLGPQADQLQVQVPPPEGVWPAGTWLIAKFPKPSKALLDIWLQG